MISSVFQGLQTTLIGREPAAPARFPRPWLSALGVIALASFGAVAIQYMNDTRGIGTSWASLVGVLSVLPLYIMFRSPLWAWRLAFIGLLFGSMNHEVNEIPWNPVQIIAVLIVLFVVALRESAIVTLWVALLTLVPMGFEMQPEHLPGSAVLIVVLLVLGNQIQRRRRVEQDLEVQSERSELAAARTRIARELHDVVAHSMSLVAVRAETAPYRLTDVPEAARAEFLALAETARESLTEMRRLLGVLRTDSDEPALTPQPGLSDLDELIASARSAGMTVRSDISVSSADDALGLTAYRIVQEALSNSARHAHGVPTEIVLKEQDGQLVIDVRNTPGPVLGSSRPGHGITGMRERAELLGGTFEAGPLPEGGFAVTARIPLGDK